MENIFGEEFSKDDIIDSKSDEQLFEELFNPKEESAILKNDSENEFDEEKLVGVDDILNYDDDKRKDKFFNYEWGSEFEIEEEERLQENFRDFLNAPKISGSIHGYSDANKIPAEKLIQSKKTIEIKDIPDAHLEHEHDENFKGSYSTIIINKNDKDEIISIDVICVCGNRTKINFEFDGSISQEVSQENNVVVKDPTKDPTLVSNTLAHQVMEAPTNFENDPQYENSLLEDFENILPDNNADFNDLLLENIDE
jgi:hypothetical protein